jgi:hypothetical protein
MTALWHLAPVVVGFWLSDHGLPASSLSGLPIVGVFALLLGVGYMLLAHRWPGPGRHLHR